MTETAFDAAVREVRGEEEQPGPIQGDRGTGEQPGPGTNGERPTRTPPRKGKAKAKSGAQKRRERAERQAKGPASSARVEGPPPPAPGIDPRLVSNVIRQLDGVIVAAAHTPPLSAQEAREGGEVWAPVFDFYFPQMAERGGIWLAPLMWTAGTYGPRILAIVEQRQAARGLPAGEPVEETAPEGPAQPGTPFRQDAEEDLRRGFVSTEPV